MLQKTENINSLVTYFLSTYIQHVVICSKQASPVEKGNLDVPLVECMCIPFIQLKIFFIPFFSLFQKIV